MFDLVSESFRCLMLANYISSPSIDSFQALLIIGHVLQNAHQVETAWMLLGLTARMTHILGLHTKIAQKRVDNVSETARMQYLSVSLPTMAAIS